MPRPQDLPPGPAEDGSPSYDDLPLHRFLGARLIDRDRPELGVRITAGEHLEVRGDQLHGGVVPLLLDGAAYQALAPHLAEGEQAVSHDLHFSLLRPVRRGQVVELRGRVVRRGRSLAFLDAEATVDGDLVATARITKTILRPPGP